MTKPCGRILPIVIHAFFITLAVLFIGFSLPDTVRATNISVTLDPPSGFAPLVVKVICTASSIDSTISKYSIDFGDGTSDSVQTDQASYTFTHTYTTGMFEPICTLSLSQGTTNPSDPVRLIVGNWRFRTSGPIDSSPAVAPDGSAVYVGSDDGNLYAIDPETGSKLWQYTTDKPVRSSPAIDPDGTIYFGSLDGNLYALRSNGTLKWRYAIGQPIFSTPAISTDNYLYIGASDGYLYSLTAAGTERWRFRTGGAIVSSPVIGTDGIENVVYFGSIDQHVYAVAADNGTLKWQFATNAPVYGSPAVGSDGKIYVGECQTQSAASYNFKFYCLNIDGTENWDLNTGTGVYASPAIGTDGTIYFGSWDGTFFALNSKGEVRWTQNLYRAFNSSPAVGSDGVIYVGCKNHNFYAMQSPNVDKADRKDWTFQTGDEIVYSSPAIGPDGTVYFGSRDGYLYAVNPGNMNLSGQWPMFHKGADHAGMAQNITLPAVISTSPAPNAAGVDRTTTQIKATFSPSMTSDDVNIDSFTLTKGTGSDLQAIEGYAVLNQTGNYMSAVYVIEGKAGLSYKTKYTASIDYVDPGNGATKTYTWSFTTAAEPVTNPTPHPKPEFCFISAAGR